MFQKPMTGGAPVSPFAHLASRLNLTTAKKAEDDEKDKKDAKAEDDEGDDKDKAKKSKKAKNEDDERGDEEEKLSAEKDEKDDGDTDDKKSKKKSKASDDDEDDKKEARATLAERNRIRAIIYSEEASISGDALEHAVDLALNTSSDVPSAMVSLRSFNRVMRAAQENGKPANRDALAQRMAASPKPDIGVDGGGGSEQTLAEKIILAGKKRRGEI